MTPIPVAMERSTVRRNFHFPAITDLLARLTSRIRWKRRINRYGLLVLAACGSYLLIYWADSALGFDVLSMRIASAAFLGCLCAGWVACVLLSWRKIDRVGVAQLLERSRPELAERLVTFVQIERDPTLSPDPEVAYSLGLELEKQVENIDPPPAYPFARDAAVLAGIVVIIAWVLAMPVWSQRFAEFSELFVSAWLVPQSRPQLALDDQVGFLKRRGSVVLPGEFGPINAGLLDRPDQESTFHLWLGMGHPFFRRPAECWLVSEDESGQQTRTAMIDLGYRNFTGSLPPAKKQLTCWAEYGLAKSNTIPIFPYDPPKLTQATRVSVTPPPYVPGAKAMPVEIAAGAELLEVVRYSRMQFNFKLDREEWHGWLWIKALPEGNVPGGGEPVISVTYPLTDEGAAPTYCAARSGRFEISLVVPNSPGTCVILPIGKLAVHDDQPPRFTEPLRIRGAGAALAADKEHRLGPGEILQVQTAVEDDYGIDTIEVEYRLHDGPMQVLPWINGQGKKQVAIDGRLPLPGGLKEGDQLQWRLRARDNRRLKRGAILQAENAVIPTDDLTPQTATLPAEVGGEARWFRFQVGKPADGLLKDHVHAQADEVRDVVAKLKEKLLAESKQLEALQRGIHLQFALTPQQRQQAERIRAFNRDITGELMRAGERFAANSELARLADLFFDIAESEMLKSAEALNRFGQGDRPVFEVEKDLQSAQDAIQQAARKLDRMSDLNKLLAQDRLDQAQIDQLAQRQDMLAQKLEQLMKDRPLSDADLAQQIEAIRQEQAKLAAERTELENENALIQESRSAVEEQKLQGLAKAAEELAKLAQAKAGKELADKADKLAAGLMELTQKGSGPEAKAMAKEAAAALEQAKKAMESAAEMKAQGKADEAKKAEEDANQKLEIVMKQLAKLAKEQAMPGPNKDGVEKTAEALAQSGKLMKSAQDKLPTMPKDAQVAMKGAAQKLAQAAQLAQKQGARRVPTPARNPSARAMLPLGGAPSSAMPRRQDLEAFQGKAWGELPGELKTQLMQDVRTRFGEEYADLIQQYFERLADVRQSERK